MSIEVKLANSSIELAEMPTQGAVVVVVAIPSCGTYVQERTGTSKQARLLTDQKRPIVESESQGSWLSWVGWIQA